MTPLQMGLIAVGVILLLASFFVSEKLSKKEVDELSRLSSAQLQKVVDKELSTIENKVTDVVGEAVDRATDELQRPMEKLSNEKIMAINEYSDTVIDQINKGHEEVLFLYNMMNEKQDELKTLLASIERNKAQLREMSDNVQVMERKTEKAVSDAAASAAPAVSAEKKDSDRERARADLMAAEAAMDELLEASEAMDPNRADPGFVFREREDDDADIDPASEGGSEDRAELRKKIIEMYDEGMSEVEIGKRLRCGVGEVRLVLELVNRGSQGQ